MTIINQTSFFIYNLYPPCFIWGVFLIQVCSFYTKCHHKVMATTTNTNMDQYEYQELVWDGHMIIKLLNRLSLGQCTEYLMNGYVKTYTTKLQYAIYPFVLQQLSIKYLGGSNFFIRFKSALTDKTKIKLINEHFAIVTEPKQPSKRSIWMQRVIHNGVWIIEMVNTSLLIDLPIPINDKSFKIKWRIKINGRRFPNGHYFIGIATDKFNAFDKTIWSQSTKNVYGVYGYELNDGNNKAVALVWNGTTYHYEYDAQKIKEMFLVIGDSNYGNEEIVECQYNGELNQLKISKVKSDCNEIICVFQMKQPSDDSRCYYPVISLRDENDTVEIQ